MDQVLVKFRADVEACLRKAEMMFGVDLSKTIIETNITGRVGGRASMFRIGCYRLNFNLEGIQKYNAEMTENTIPHEVAHLVCFARPFYGKNHDAGWKSVCRRLGGDDSRCHDMLLTSARPPRERIRHIYNVCGQIYQIGPKQHIKIQEGALYTTKNHKSGRAIRISPMMWEHYGVDAPVKVAASAPTTPSTNQPTFATATKRQMAETIYKNNRGLARKDVIALFMSDAGMTKAGASTYYQTFKSTGI